MGYACFIPCIYFPAFIVFILEKKKNCQFNTVIEEEEFDEAYSVLYEDIRTDLPGYLQFYSVYLFRRLVYVILVYFFTEPEFISV